MRLMDLFVKYEINKADEEDFKKIVTSNNLKVLKIIGLVLTIIEIGIFFLVFGGIISPENINSFYELFAFILLPLVSSLMIIILMKKELWALKVVITELISFIAYCFALSVIIITNISGSYVDLSILFIIFLITHIAVVNKPLWVILRNFCIFFITIVALFLLDFKIHTNALINFFVFVILSTVSSIIIYNNQLRIFIEQARVHEANDKLNKLSVTDQLTGLANRRKIDKEIKKVVNSMDYSSSSLSLILIDIDFFKEVNDNYGHLIGDEILIQFAELIRNSIRPHDLVGRWGGEEFLIICKLTNIEEAKALAERIRIVVQNHIFIDGIKISASFGVVQVTNNDLRHEVLNFVDKALYIAKENGRNRVETYNGKM